MENNKIINHEITEHMCESKEQMVEKLKDEFLRFGIERDSSVLDIFADELMENTDKTIFTSTYQLEFLVDALFTFLIISKVFTEKDAKELWLAAQKDENDQFEEFNSLLKTLLNKGEY